MLPTFFSSAFALWLPVIFGLSVAFRHAGPGVLQHFGEGWTFTPGIDRVIRLVELSIAVLLPLPQARFLNALLEHARSISARDFLTLAAITIMPPKTALIARRVGVSTNFPRCAREQRQAMQPFSGFAKL